MGKTEYNGVELKLLNHAAVRITGKSATVCIDPFGIEKGFEADVLVVTHEHYDHCSPADIEKVLKEGTAVFAAQSACGKLETDCTALKPGDTAEAAGVKLEAVEAYNTNKEFHPKGLGIGVIVEIDGVRVYHAGDTDLIEEMKALKGKVDVAFLPVSGTYVMNAQEAVEAAKRIGPSMVVPMHYGAIVGKRENAEAFSKAWGGKTEILL